MSELGTLEALEARTGLLRQPGSEHELVNNSAAFTRAAAWELRDQGWGNVRKTSGLNVQGLDVDKILNRHTLEMVDIIIGAGAPGQRVAWQSVATGVPSQFVEPQPFDGQQPNPQPEPGDELVHLEEIRDLLDGMDDKLQAIADDQRATREHVASINAILGRAAERFGI